MKVSIRRCRHCGVEFHTKSFGWLDELCPGCRSVVEDVLKGIPVRFCGRWKEVECVEDVRGMIESIRNYYCEDSEIRIAPSEFVPCGMSSGECVIWNGVKWCLCMDGSGGEHAFQYMEYDMVEDVFTGKVWIVGGCDCVYSMMSGITVAAGEVVEVEVDKPYGCLNYLSSVIR